MIKDEDKTEFSFFMMYGSTSDGGGNTMGFGLGHGKGSARGDDYGGGYGGGSTLTDVDNKCKSIVIDILI